MTLPKESPDDVELAVELMKQAAVLLKKHINTSVRKLTREEYEQLASHNRKLTKRIVMLGRGQGMSPGEIASCTRMSESDVLGIQVEQLNQQRLGRD